jgi:hypothetical protein
MKHIMAMLLALTLLAQSTSGWAESNTQEGTLSQVGTGVGSVVGSAVYFPFKAVFCILGGIGSGFTLLAAGPDTADKVASASCRGTWVITPDIVKGNEAVHFVGEPRPSPESKQARTE